MMGPSISESSRIPKWKKLFAGREFGFIPLFTGQVFFVRRGLLWRDSREGTEVLAGMSGRRWPNPGTTAMVRPNRPSTFNPEDMP